MTTHRPGIDEHRTRLPVAAEQAWEAVARAAEIWGAEWSRLGGRLELPLAAGLRYGEARAQLWVEPATEGSEVVLRVEERTYRLRTRAVAVLVLAAAGALASMLWPFFPPLIPVAPAGAILALAAWFLVVSRLTTSGPEDFLELVRAFAAGEEEDEEEDEPPDGG